MGCCFDSPPPAVWVQSPMQTNHCEHCLGGACPCVCPRGCPRRRATECYASPAASRGGYAPMGSPPSSALVVRSPQHCSHCRGLSGECGCSNGCRKPPGAQCYAASRGHCSHCRGLNGECGCSHGCYKPAGVQCYSSTVVMSAAANRINLVLAADKSGSMAGARWRSVRSGIHDAIANLTDNDVITVIPFNDEIDGIGPAPKCRFPQNSIDEIVPGGGTHLYDAIAVALIGAIKLHSVVDSSTQMQTITYVVVMTDGDDQGSRISLPELCEVVERVNHLRNFKIIFAGIQLPDAGRAALRRLSAIGDSDIQFMDLAGGSFDSVFEHLRLQMSVIRRT